MSAESRIAFVTVSYGSGDELERLLTSLREHEAENIDVIVVDNKPGDDGVENLASRFGVQYLALPHNPGYGAGMNAGVQALRERLNRNNESFSAVFVCNPDVEFIEPVTSELLEVLQSEASIGAVGPALLEDDGSVYPSARNIPSISTGIGHGIFGKIWPKNPWSRAYKNAADSSVRRDAGWLSGAAVMVRADVWDAIGGFDEAYFLNFEDIDLGYRIGLAGYRNVYLPNVRVRHSGGHSTEKHAELAERAMHTSAIRFMRKRYSGPLNAPLRWVIILGLRLRGALRVASIRRDSRSD